MPARSLIDRLSLGHVRVTALAIFLSIAAGCAGVPAARPGGADASAEAWLARAAAEQSRSALTRLDVVDVHFAGHWSPVIGHIEPVLTDEQFRGVSDERYFVKRPVVEQTHYGPGGVKGVFRGPGVVHVRYNGLPNKDPDVDHAAALVADGYRLFFFGPSFLIERRAVLQDLGPDRVDGHCCQNLLAILRPGIGDSPEDRVVVSLDRTTARPVRYRVTVNGMDATQGGIADIHVGEFVRFDGIDWPTRFYEELKRPVDIAVHHWRATSISYETSASGEQPDRSER